MPPRLYTTPRSANGLKPLVVAARLGIELEVEEVDVYRGEGLRPAFRALNPLGKIPVLVDDAGILTESNAIALYLADAHGGLSSPDPRIRADITRWLLWEAAHWQPALSALLVPHVTWRLGLGPAPSAAVDWTLQPFARLARHLDRSLSTGHLVGDDWTVADVCVGAMLVYTAGTGFPADTYPAVAAWHGALSSWDAWTSVVRDTEWAP